MFSKHVRWQSTLPIATRILHPSCLTIVCWRMFFRLLRSLKSQAVLSAVWSPEARLFCLCRKKITIRFLIEGHELKPAFLSISTAFSSARLGGDLFFISGVEAGICL